MANIKNVVFICICVFFGAAMVAVYWRYFGGSLNTLIISVCLPAVSALLIWGINKFQGSPVDEKRQTTIVFLTYALAIFYLAVRMFMDFMAK